ncbi:MAG: thioredoxin domain-containing protein [Patescibacteria group bacterium]
MKNNQAKILVYLSVLSVFVLLIIFAYYQAVFIQNPSTNQNTNTNNEVVNGGALELGYDPLITVVPEELQSLQAKSNIFISTFDPKIGSSQAKVIITLFADLSNPDLPDLFNILEEVYAENPEDLVVVWKDFVAITDPPSVSLRAAEAVHCAHDQEKFWDLFKFLLNNQANFSDNFFKESAKDKELDYEEFLACFENNMMKPVVEQSYYYSRTVGIEKAPTIFINDEKLEDDFTKEKIEEKINIILDALKQE